MEKDFQGFVGQTYESRSLNVDAQRTINYFIEIDKTGKRPMSLIGTPGTSLWCPLGGMPIRGSHVFNGTLYVVSGTYLYAITSNAVATVIGNIQTFTGRVAMADNGTSPTGGNQLIIVDGVYGYIYTIGGTLVQINNPFPNGASIVIFISGFFVVDVPNSPGTFQVSAIYDGLTWNALDKTTADTNPDKLISMANSHGEAWIIGERTVEVWYMDGSNGHPPFSRIPGVVVEHGSAAKFSLASGDSTLFWLAQNGEGHVYAVRANGYNITVISNPALEYIWNNYNVISDAFAYCYVSEGHVFYVLTFPSGNATYVYDVGTQMWHERSQYTGNPYAINRHVSNSYDFLNGKHLVGDYTNGNIYEMHSKYYMDNGYPIVSMRRTPHVFDNQKMLFHRSLEVLVEPGSYLTTDSFTPVSSIRWSDDGGHTWSNSYSRPLGQQGQYKQRSIWRKLGASRDRIYEYTCSEPIKKVIIGAILNIEAGV